MGLRRVLWLFEIGLGLPFVLDLVEERKKREVEETKVSRPRRRRRRPVRHPTTTTTHPQSTNKSASRTKSKSKSGQSVESIRFGSEASFTSTWTEEGETP